MNQTMPTQPSTEGAPSNGKRASRKARQVFLAMQGKVRWVIKYQEGDQWCWCGSPVFDPNYTYTDRANAVTAAKKYTQEAALDSSRRTTIYRAMREIMP
jgi:hypothetical protein